MRPPCELVSQIFLPLIRGMVALELTSNMTQQEVAEKMGVSQPTISSYLKSLEKFQEVGEEYLESETVSNLVKKVSAMILANETPEEIIRTICSSCVSMRIGGITCRKHLSSYSGINQGCTGCLPIVDKTLVDERKAILETLTESIKLIEEDVSFVKLLPQVMTNICQSISNPETIEDVAAIPGRITKVKGKARVNFPPEFGVSEHMAKFLISLGTINQDIRALICITYNEEIKTVLEKMKTKNHTIDNETMEQLLSQYDSSLTSLSKKYPSYTEFINEYKAKSVYAIITLGSIGIEPIVYLFGDSALDLTKFVLGVAKEI
ncbi:MAG: winged helix-turn-helix transcriptional regulator [Asgard group archaeon]|nr:winged helix-turn-helix transcriptional regulator [Asgard group archaeon]